MPCRVATALSLTALAAVAAAPAAGDVAPLVAPPATVKLVDCSREARSATFHGRMKPVEGSERMWMRFTLQERFGTPNFHAIKVPELMTWRKSEPGVKLFSYTQRVRSLQPGGSYRMRVDFRWYDADGDLIEETRRHSSACGKPGPLPNLQIADVRARPGSAEGTVDYAVDVFNAGEILAEDVEVTLIVDGVLLDLREASELQPGEVATLRFSGPPCANRVKASADPDDGINESDETDNRRAYLCSSLFSG